MASEIDRLVVVLDARLDRMEAQLKKAVTANEKAAHKIEDVWKHQSGALGAAMAEGLEHVASSANKLPVLGAALERMGVAGAAAAVGVGAFLEAMHLGKEAIEFGAQIADVAEKLGISTTALQEYRFVVEQTGGTQEEADASLKSFEQTLGAAALGAVKAARAFKALHLDPKELSAEGVPAALDKTVEALSRVKEQAERAALAQKTGLDAFLAAAGLSVDAYLALKQAAHDAGGVMSEEVLATSKETADKLKVLEQVIKTQLATAFVAMAPVILTVVEYLALTAGAVADLGAEFKKVPEQMRGLLSGLDQVINKLVGAYIAFDSFMTKYNTLWKATGGGPKLDPHGGLAGLMQGNLLWSGALEGKGAPPLPPAAPGSAREVEEKIADNWRRRKAAMDKLLAQMFPRAEGQGGMTPGSLAKEKTGPKITDTTQKRLEDAAAALAGAMRSHLQAELALTTDIDERAALEQQIAAKEYDQQIAELEKKRGEAEADAKAGKLKDAAALKAINADLDKAEAEQALAEHAKEELITRQALVAKVQQEQAQVDADVARMADQSKAEEDLLTAQADLATSTAVRNDFERQALVIRQQRERDLAAAQVEHARSELLAAALAKDPAKIAQARTAFGRALDAQAALGPSQQLQTERQGVEQLDALHKYARELKSFDDLVQDEAVTAISGLADGFAEAIVNAKSLTDVAESVFKQIAADLISAFLKKTFLSFLGIPAMAAGGMSAGGLTLVGEQGPELVNLPGGARVIPNSSLRNVAVRGGGAGQPVILFDNRGAVIWEQAARAMMAYADRSAMQAGVGAVSIARHTTPTDMARMGARSLGR